MPTGTKQITDEQIDQFHNEGYFILERAIDEDLLRRLRDESEQFMERINEDMAAKGVESDGLNHRDKRYFIANRWKEGNAVKDVLFGDLMAEVCQATLGANAYLFHEQWVIKCAEVGMKFSWHQDSGYVGCPHKPYITCWLTLDDVNEDNGTVYLLPYSRADTRDAVEHGQSADGSNDLQGYFGDDPGIPVICPAGSLAVFSSTVFHRSGANTTNLPRRVYLPQYSPEIIRKPDGSLRALAEPIWIDGQRQPRPE